MCLVPQTSRTAPGSPNIEGSATRGAVIGAVLSCLLVHVADFSRQTRPGILVVTDCPSSVSPACLHRDPLRVGGGTSK